MNLFATGTKRITLAAAAAGITLLVSGYALAAEKPATAPAKPQPQAQKAAPATAKPAGESAAPQNQQQKQQVNAVTASALKVGAKKCAPRINQVTTFLAKGSKDSGAFLFFPNDQQDTRMLSASMEIIGDKNQTAYATASFSPKQEGCDGMYETIVYWPQGCGEVAKTQFASMKQVGTLKAGIPVLQGQGSPRVFLMQAGTGCVSIKKEMIW